MLSVTRTSSDPRRAAPSASSPSSPSPPPAPPERRQHSRRRRRPLSGKPSPTASRASAARRSRRWARSPRPSTRRGCCRVPSPTSPGSSPGSFQTGTLQMAGAAVRGLGQARDRGRVRRRPGARRQGGRRGADARVRADAGRGAGPEKCRGRIGQGGVAQQPCFRGRGRGAHAGLRRVSEPALPPHLGQLRGGQGTTCWLPGPVLPV